MFVRTPIYCIKEFSNLA